MRKTTAWFVITTALMLAGPAAAYAGKWLVVEDVQTQTCYRMTQMPDGDNWRQLGIFNTFRQAGMWTWEHRDICLHSPVFS
jgi:hypothetical protein